MARRARFLLSSFSGSFLPCGIVLAVAVVCAGAQAQTAHFSGAVNTVGSGFSFPQGVAVDGSGDVFVSDPGDSAVKEIVAAGGIVSSSSPVNTVGSGFNSPQGVAVDGSGDVFVADTGHSAVEEIVAGTGGAAVGTVNATSTVNIVGSGFGLPFGVAVDGSGDVFVADNGNSVVQEIVAVGGVVSSSSTVKTVGSGFNFPIGVAVDGSGDVFVADPGYDVVQEIVAGTGGAAVGTVNATSTVNTVGSGFSSPLGVAVDSSGDVFVADYGDSAVKEIVAAGGGVSSSSTVNTLGSGFNSPAGVAVDGSGNVFVADSGNNAVKEIMFAGVNFLTVPVGTASASQMLTFTFDSGGQLSSAAPYQVLTQGAAGLDFNAASTQESSVCNLTTTYNPGDTCTVDVTFKPQYAGTRYGAVELLNSSGSVIATAYIYGTGTGPQIAYGPAAQDTLANATTNGLSDPNNVAVDASGNVYIVDYGNDRVLKETLSGGSYTQSIIGSGLSNPWGVAVDGAGNIYIADGGNSRVLKETLSGSSYTQSIIGSGLSYPYGVAVDGSGNVYIANSGTDTVVKETYSNGSYTQSTVVSTGLSDPLGVAADASGNVYIADNGGDNEVLKETLSGGSYTQSTIGSGLSSPIGVAVDASGNVYIADNGTNNVLKETLSGGSYTQSTVANAATNGLNSPDGVAVDGSGNVYIADFYNSRVLKEDVSDAPSLSFPTSTADGATDTTDGPMSVTVMNDGNASLTAVPPGLSVSADFTQATGSGTPLDCTASFSLAAGASCNLSLEFAPVAPADGAVSGSVVLTDNNLNASPSATQTIALNGTASAGPVTHFSLSPTTFTSYVNTFITVTALDTYDNIVTTYDGTVSFSSSDPGFINSGPLTLVSGTQSADGYGCKLAGSQTITITDTSNGSLTSTIPIVCDPGPAVRLAIAVPATVTAGVPFTFTVSAFDLYSNVAISYIGTVGFTSSDATAVLPPNYTFTGVDAGTHVFAAGTTLKTLGNQTITATDTGNPSMTGTSGPIVVGIPGFVVTTAADDAGTASNCPAGGPSGGSGLDCSLRDALAAAALDGSGNITFSSTVFTSSNTTAQNTITLTNGVLTVPPNTTVQGPTTGSGPTLDNLVTVSGNSATQIFTVASGVTASVSNLVLQKALGTNSQLGGAVYNAGQLALSGDLIEGSQPSTYSGGAGIYNDATGALTLNATTINGNGSSYFGGTSGYGGGIFNNGGNITIASSTVSSNNASESGGNIFSNGGLIVIDNSTITGSAGTLNGGGLAMNGGAVTVTDSTIAYNFAGSNPGVLVAGGTITVTNSIVAGNGTPASTGNCTGCALTGNNIVDINPQLSPLSNYGGTTQTLVPLPGSPAICGGAATADTKDQRGYNRPNGSCYDVGAVETNYSIAFVQQPSTVVQNAAMAPAPTVQLDESGVPFTGGSASIPLTLSTGSGALSGSTTSTAATTGVAAYSALSVNTAGTGDVLAATLPLNPGLTPALSISTTSNSFNVTPAVTQLAFATPPVSTVTAGGNTGTVIVDEENAGGVLVTGASDTITLSVTGPNGYSETYQQQASGGVATFNLASVTLTSPGSYSYTATSGSLTHAIAPETVNQIQPVINWLQPAAIPYGTTLAGVLNAVAMNGAAAVAGTYSYTVASAPVTSATVLPASATAYTLSVSFTPTDTTTYKTATGTVSLTVNKAAVGSITLASSVNPILVDNATTLTATVTSVASMPTGSVSFYDNTTSTALGSGPLVGGVATLPVSTLADGAHSITAIYSGDPNFLSATSAAVSEQVDDFTLNAGAGSSKIIITPGGTATYNINVVPFGSSTLPSAVSFSVSGLPAGATYTFTPPTIAAGSGPTNVTLTISLPQENAVLHHEGRFGAGLAPIALGLLLLPFSFKSRKAASRLGRMTALLLLLIAGAASVAGLTGCGASNGFLSQPQQNYTVTITGTSGALTHSTTVQLTVE